MHGHVRCRLRGNRTSGRAANSLRCCYFSWGAWRAIPWLGGLAAASLQGLGWLTIQSAALRPVWSLFHVAALVLEGSCWCRHGKSMVARGRCAKGLARVRGFASTWGGGAPLVLGSLWGSWLPCAPVLGAHGGSAGGQRRRRAGHGVVCAGHERNHALPLALWLRLRGAPSSPGNGQGACVCGLALAASSGWALWMALAHNTAPWCIAPS